MLREDIEFVNDSVLIWSEGIFSYGMSQDSFVYFKQKNIISLKNDTIETDKGKKITQFIFHPIWVKDDYSKNFIRCDNKKRFSIGKRYLEPIFIKSKPIEK